MITAFLKNINQEGYMYRIDSRILGMVGTNCYLLCNEDIKECVLIDPADRADEPALPL